MGLLQCLPHIFAAFLLILLILSECSFFGTSSSAILFRLLPSPLTSAGTYLLLFLFLANRRGVNLRLALAPQVDSLRPLVGGRFRPSPQAESFFLLLVSSIPCHITFLKQVLFSYKACFFTREATTANLLFLLATHFFTPCFSGTEFFLCLMKASRNCSHFFVGLRVP